MNHHKAMPGVASALVKERNGKGQIKVEYPWLDESLRSDWISMASAMAGKGRGLCVMPEIGDEVLVAFTHGHFDKPVVIGALWNGVDAPPHGDPRERIFRSVNGHAIRMIDSTPGNGDFGCLVIEDAHGNMITLSNGKISITATAVLELEAPFVTINGRSVQFVDAPI
jgi:uncharacterized protein involved in type VI secretion and phage assembly